MSNVTNYFKQVDFKKVRTAQPPELIFLCGGNDLPQNTHLRPKLQKALIDKKHNVVLAEEAMDWQGGQNFAKDLLELEKYYAALVSIIPLICESYGAVAELGAFVNDEAIRNKLFIIIKEKYYSGKESSSFIRNGPIKNFEDNTGRKAFCINDNTPENDIESLCNDIICCKPRTSVCDFSKGYFQILLLIDIISLLVISEFKDIKSILLKALEFAGQEKLGLNNEEKLNEMLFVLEKLNLIKKRIKGSRTYFLSKNIKFYLEYRAKSSADYIKITTARKNNLQCMHSSTDENDKIKVSILKEEEKNKDILWLQKTPLDKINIEVLLRTAPLQYKVYEIQKKSGGTRIIAQPTPQLKQAQRVRVPELEEILSVHDSAKAYVKGKNGTLENAKSHKDNSFFYKFDFINFFPSIKARDLNKKLEEKQISLEKRIDWLRLIFRFDKDSSKIKTQQIYKKLNDTDFNINSNPQLLELMIEDFKDEFQLSIGAPSSPFISNAIMYDFDCAVQCWANDNDCVYTRFADDITFSSNKKIDIKFFEQALLEILSKTRYPNLSLNSKKQRYCSFKDKVNITGLNITPNHNISIGREQKKKISAMIHHYKMESLIKDQINKLRGWLAYSKDVDPNFVRSMEKKYSLETIEKIMRECSK